MLKRDDIRKLAAGVIPFSLKNTPFIVMRSSVRFYVGDFVGWEYHVCFDPEGKDKTPVTKEKADMIIDAFGMVLAHAQKEGRIYEVPGMPFMAAFGHKTQLQ